jgi:drug/metabolite transporter (DMT)-like permease
MTLGLVLAIAGAVTTSVAFLLEHRGATEAPAVDIRHPLRSAAGLFRSRWFVIGLGLAALAWGLHVGALALAPLSVVQAVFAGGLVFLAVLAERCFGFKLGPRQWVGLTVAAAGLAVIALTGGSGDGNSNRYALAALIALEGGAFIAAIALIAGSARHPSLRSRQGFVLAVAAGTLYGVADIAIKFLTGAARGGLLALVNPWAAVAAMAGVAAFYAGARALQIGPGVSVIAITSVAANVTAIVGGVLVFREALGVDALAIVGRVLAFSLVILGAALMPAPVRAVGGIEARASRPA